METGRTVILLNLDHLYESLYDTLNQVHEMACLYNLTLNNYSIMFTLEKNDLLTWAYKIIMLNAGFTIISSKQGTNKIIFIIMQCLIIDLY